MPDSRREDAVASRSRRCRRAGRAAGAASAPRPRAGGTPGGRGTSAATPGLEFGPPGLGVPDGTDTGGDWYLAGVQQKIWMIWTQQIKAGFTQPVGVTFTILADGTVADVRVTQPSGATLLDIAAQRAVLPRRRSVRSQRTMEPIDRRSRPSSSRRRSAAR